MSQNDEVKALGQVPVKEALKQWLVKNRPPEKYS
jgi:hypothetical protein